MTIKNKLPTRGVDDARRVEAERELLFAFAADRARRSRFSPVGRRSTVIGVVIAVAVGGAGTAAAAGLGLFNLGAVHHVGPKAYPTSNHLGLQITPASGPLGTMVTVHVTGCFDPKRDSHDVSYNAVGSLNLNTMQMQAYPGAETVIRTEQVGGNLTGRFRVNYAPVRVGQFTAQCGASMVQRNFTVAGALTAAK